MKPYRLPHFCVHHGRTLEEFDDASFDLVEEQLLPVDGPGNGRVILVQRWIVFVLLSVRSVRAVAIFNISRKTAVFTLKYKTDNILIIQDY